MWTIKAAALSQQAYVDDTELEEEGIAEILLDDNAMQKTPRPGTSLRQGTASAASAAGSDISASVRPMTGGGRPLSGFVRPGTQSRGKADGAAGGDAAFKQGRPGTSRPMSVAGRFIRLATQSSLLSSSPSQFINPALIVPAKFVSKPAEALALSQYLLTVDINHRVCLELCAAMTTANEFRHWLYKLRLAKCYYALAMYRDAEQQLKSILANQPETADITLVLLELSKVYLRLDQPMTAIALITDWMARESQRLSADVSLLTCLARIHDTVRNESRAMELYRGILGLDSGHVESIAMLASHFFYSDQPELALRYYRRLVQMGINNTELWNNLALCCFYSSQYDMALQCFDRALALASDTNAADVWYNIGQLGVGIGDLNLAAQSFKVAISLDAQHAESFNNLGILELKKNNLELSRHYFHTAIGIAPHLFEPAFNGALIALKCGDYQESFQLVSQALAAYPEHQESKELMRQLKRQFTM